MDAKELRIGNLVNTKDGITTVYDVLEFGINMHHDCWLYDIKDVSPIPLTEEWLIKLGFEDNKTHFTKWINEDRTFIVEYDVMDTRYFLCDTDVDTNIKYVHQLQNLYKALTGGELTIKQKHQP